MNDYVRYRGIADELKAAGNHVAAEAIADLLAVSTTTNEAHQQAQHLAKRVAELEAALEIARGIRYQEMQLHLPEGGAVTLRWPESMSLESAEMLREVFDLQMKAHAKYVSNLASKAEIAKGDGDADK